MSSVYQINKGINKEIEFKGFKAQYIWYLGGLLVALVFVFAVLYITGVPPLLCVILITATGAYGATKIYRLSNKYGRYGMMKHLARKQVPRIVKCRSRKIFYFSKHS